MEEERFTVTGKISEGQTDFKDYQNSFIPGEYGANENSNKTREDVVVEHALKKKSAGVEEGKIKQIKYECERCKRSFFRDHYFKIHKCSNERLFKCDFCEKAFFTKRNLADHRRQHTGERPYVCKICGKSFKVTSHLSEHTKLHTGERPYKCQMCSKGFIKKSNLDVHVRSHTGEKPYQCDICLKRFVTTANLSAHNRIHSGDKRFQCETCQKTFCTKSNLVDHQFTHSSERHFQCKICFKYFGSRSYLSIHKRFHSEDRPFKCDVCDKTFITKYNFFVHQRKHSGEKPFKCDVCEKSFTTKGCLQDHQVIHSGEKPYGCDPCAKAFVSRSGLSLHRKKVHEQVMQLSKPQHTSKVLGIQEHQLKTGHTICSSFSCQPQTHDNDSQLLFDIPTQEQQVNFMLQQSQASELLSNQNVLPGRPCEVCKKLFTTESVLARHRKSCTGAKLYNCKRCDASFIQLCDFLTHQTSHVLVT